MSAISVTRPRDKDGVLDATLLIVRDDGFEAAEARIQDELNDVPTGVDDETWQKEKNALLNALSEVRKMQRGRQ